ncbi:ester cyclase [Tenacibaculum gallaicum]|uniref:ester cyclase n=1 Tax=Tenacibaculum gallaicum TaxID=561505 RepID=UPI001472F1B1
MKEFNTTNKQLLSAFPDIEFTINEIFGDVNNVITLYNWSGTHKNIYSNILPTDKKNNS